MSTPPAGCPGFDQASRGASDHPSRPTPDELLEGLNEPQRAAVVHAGAPLLVVAGAGSGKTRVLTRRIAWLISERKAHPGSILAITFTNKAAAEMKERVEELVGRRARVMWVSTFHSACVRILRKEIDKLGFKSNFSIYDAQDQKRLMTLVIRDLDLDPRRYQPGPVLHWVSNHKNELRDHEEVAADARNEIEETYAAAYTTYQRRLREANALDFDDLIMTTVHLFQAFPEVREVYRRRFRHVLVDEYQDTNHAQYALIHQLCADDPELGSTEERVEPAELMVVGDADQSIYAFRGANIRNILDFEQDFPNATTIMLEQNYRSTQTILNAANSVIGHNQGRKPKRLWSDAGDGERIVGYVADDEHDEARFVSEEIDTLTDEGAKPGDVAVFYRTNAQSRVFEEVFIRTGQPYKVVGGVRFYERREVRDALAYLRMLVNPDDQVSLRRILNVPKRGIGDRAVAVRRRRWPTASGSRSGRRCAGPRRRPGWPPGRLTNIQGFVAMVEELQSMVDAGERADVILESVLARSGYLERARGVRGPSGRHPGGEPRRARRGRPRVLRGPGRRALGRPGRRRRRHRRARASATSSSGSRWSPTPTRSPTSPTPTTGRGHADDPAHRQGPGVPGGVPDRARGRRLPALALARRPARARGGAAARVRRHHPGPRAALHLPRRGALGVGRAVAQPGLPVPRRAPGRPRRLAAHRGRPDLVGPHRPGQRLARAARGARPPPVGATSPRPPPAPTPPPKAKPAREIPSLEPGDRVRPRLVRHGHGRRRRGAADKSVASIDFGSEGVKRLLLRYAPVEKL